MAATKAKTKTEPRDSRRVKVIVTRKYSEHKNKIFASTTILEKGKRILKQFRIPVDTAVEIPVEIARMLKERKVAKFVDNKQEMVPEFVIDRADDNF